MVTLNDPKSPKISLIYINTQNRKEAIRSHLNGCLSDIMKQMFVEKPMTIVTDQSQLYKFLDETLDHNNRPKFNHQVCRHDQNKYISKDGYSSNRLEAAFSHIRRSWRGVYQFWTRTYNQLYLDEFCFRYNHKLSSKHVTFKRMQEFFNCIDPRVLVQFD